MGQGLKLEEASLGKGASFLQGEKKKEGVFPPGSKDLTLWTRRPPHRAPEGLLRRSETQAAPGPPHLPGPLFSFLRPPPHTPLLPSASCTPTPPTQAEASPREGSLHPARGHQTPGTPGPGYKQAGPNGPASAREAFPGPHPRSL